MSDSGDEQKSGKKRKAPDDEYMKLLSIAFEEQPIAMIQAPPQPPPVAVIVDLSSLLALGGGMPQSRFAQFARQPSIPRGPPDYEQKRPLMFSTDGKPSLVRVGTSGFDFAVIRCAFASSPVLTFALRAGPANTTQTTTRTE